MTLRYSIIYNFLTTKSLYYLSQSHNVNNSKPEYNFGFPPEINNKNISEIPNDSFFDGDSKFDFNLVNDNNRH